MIYLKKKTKKNQIFPLFPIKVKKKLIFNHYQWKNLIKVHYNTY